MAWFKVDDKLHDHHKIRAAGKAAMGVWMLAGSWSADNLTDGFVPKSVLSRWGTPADAKRLVEAGLWEVATRHGERGWQFHDWAEYQPSRTETLARREQDRQRKAEARAALAAKREAERATERLI
jgi:hypothetical protein